MLNRPHINDEGASLQQSHSTRLEGGQVERLSERESLVGKDRERQMESLSRFGLILDRLGGESKEVVHPQRFQLGIVVSKRTGLRRAAPGSRDEIPSLGIVNAGSPGSWVGVHHGSTFQD